MAPPADTPEQRVPQDDGDAEATVQFATLQAIEGARRRALGLVLDCSVDELGAVAWPNGYDLGPDWLYARIAGRPYAAPQQPATFAGRERSGDDI